MPVFGVDGITDAESAEQALQCSSMDMIDVGRGFFVNPDFGNTALEGRGCGKCLHCRPACRWSPFLNDGTVQCLGRNLFLRSQGNECCKKTMGEEEANVKEYQRCADKTDSGAFGLILRHGLHRPERTGDELRISRETQKMVLDTAREMNYQSGKPRKRKRMGKTIRLLSVEDGGLGYSGICNI